VLHAPLQQIRHTELLSNLTHVIRCGLVAFNTISASHFKVVDFRKSIDDFLLYALSEAGILIGSAKIFEWQDRDAPFTRDGWSLLFRSLGGVRRASSSLEVSIQKDCGADYDCGQDNRSVHINGSNETELSRRERERGEQQTEETKS
jgi:hypothetical protein